MSEICTVCGLPKDVCVCEEENRKQQHLRVYTERRRYGKWMTVVKGFSGLSKEELEKLEKTLKTHCAAGGAVKEGGGEMWLEIQGSQKRKIEKELEKLGFRIGE